MVDGGWWMVDILSLMLTCYLMVTVGHREVKGALKTRDSRSVSKLRHTRPRQYGLGCGGASQAVTWIPVSVSVDTPRHVTGAASHSESAAYGRTRDGRRNYVHFVTAYDIHFIVNNKYYAMNTGKVRNLPIFSKKFPAFGAII